MNFDSAEVLSLSQNSELIGNGVAFRALQNIGIRSRLVNTKTEITVSPVWSGIDELTNFTGYEPIILNGVNIGTGRLLSISFEEDTDTRFKRYRAEIQITKEVESYNVLTGIYFTDISGYAKPYFKYLNVISENCSFNKTSDDLYDFNQTLSVEVDSIYPNDPKTLAKTIASGLFENNQFLNLIGITVGNLYLNSGNGLYYNNETHDNINQTYSFTQRIQSRASGDYVWKYNHSVEYSSDGIVNISENGNIVSTKKINNNVFTAASGGWDVVRTGIYNRASGLYDSYFKNGSGQFFFSGDCNIKNQPTQSSVTKNIYAGTIDYNYSYSNDPTINSGYSYTYEDTVTLDQAGFVSISERGDIQGFLKDRSQNFTFVKNKWATLKPQVYPRITGYIDSFLNTEDCKTLVTGSLTTTEESYSEYNGNISYDYEYSSNPDNIPSGDFLKISIERTNNAPVHNAVTYAVAHFDEIVQFTKQSTRGIFTNKITMLAKTGVPFTGLLNAGFARVIKPSGSDIYVTDFSYDFSPQTNSMDMQLTYSYSDYREGNNILV
jgi:hypothetical protein